MLARPVLAERLGRFPAMLPPCPAAAGPCNSVSAYLLLTLRLPRQRILAALGGLGDHSSLNAGRSLAGTFQRSAVRVVTALGLAGVASCTRVPLICAGQCTPPYELEVDFHPGTSPGAAEKVLNSRAGRNPVVIRIGTLHDLSAPRGMETGR
jgi:hypothetical protein